MVIWHMGHTFIIICIYNQWSVINYSWFWQHHFNFQKHILWESAVLGIKAIHFFTNDYLKWKKNHNPFIRNTFTISGISFTLLKQTLYWIDLFSAIGWRLLFGLGVRRGHATSETSRRHGTYQRPSSSCHQVLDGRCHRWKTGVWTKGKHCLNS